MQSSNIQHHNILYGIVKKSFVGKSMVIESVASVSDSLNISQAMTTQSLLTFIESRIYLITCTAQCTHKLQSHIYSGSIHKITIII